MPSVCIRTARQHAEILTLDIPEQQLLVGITGAGGGVHWEHHVFLKRVNGTIWAAADSDLRVAVEDFQGETLIPLHRHAQFPEDCLPLLAVGSLPAEELAQIRGRAMQLASIHGAPAAPAGAPAVGGAAAAAEWLFADPAHPLFGTAVSAADLTDCDMHLEDVAGIIRCADGLSAPRWVFVEKVLPEHRGNWLLDKHLGAGRDPRLTTLPVPAGARPVPFRDAVVVFERGVEPARPRFEGPCACEEILNFFDGTGMEPSGAMQGYFAAQGISSGSALAREMTIHAHTLWLLWCVDRYQVARSSAAQHVSRRLLQQLAAVRRNPKSPDFEGLEPYMRHVGDLGGMMRAPKFDSWVATSMKDLAQVQKQARMVKEEAEAAAKPGRNGKNNKKTEAE